MFSSFQYNNNMPIIMPLFNDIKILRMCILLFVLLFPHLGFNVLIKQNNKLYLGIHRISYQDTTLFIDNNSLIIW